MRILTSRSLEQDPSQYAEIAQVLSEEGLICFPSQRQYVVGAALLSEAAVLRLVQSKRRASRAPALVLIPDRRGLNGLVGAFPPAARTLMEHFWPGPLTLLFPPGDKLPERVVRTLLDKKRPKLGVRICTGTFAPRILEVFGGPLLISSANISQKVGASSIAQIRKNFAHTVDLLVDAGDLPAGRPSTIVDFVDDEVKVQREGAIAAAEIHRVLEQALLDAAAPLAAGI
ncbi:MAG: L-threonylcarbamoyladenylate synthase [Myxococcota bacterium]|jgi:L-threonylcarbamoyladenylate synthase|nr:L-threonylcarbamoyladenylate synthase [Myxococcota bacterium]